MEKQRIRIYDIENLPFGTKVIFTNNDGVEYNAISFGDKLGFENGNYIEVKDISEYRIYLGWK